MERCVLKSFLVADLSFDPHHNFFGRHLGIPLSDPLKGDFFVQGNDPKLVEQFPAPRLNQNRALHSTGVELLQTPCVIEVAQHQFFYLGARYVG
jgi:hypothetical protein